MKQKKRVVNIWIWIQNGKIIKAISCEKDGILKVYDEHDRLLLKRTGLKKMQVRQIENTIKKYGAKSLDKNAHSFKFL